MSSPRWHLEGEEARHLSKILRAKPGDRFTAFDGKGHEADGEVLEIKRNQIIFKALEKIKAIDRRPQQRITVAVAFPKARSRGILMEKLVELGVKEVQPLITQRSVDAPDKDRLLAQSITACKQCGINTLPLIHPALKLKDYLRQNNSNVWLLHPEGSSTAPEADHITVMAGPEGGFSEEELKQISYKRWSLGNQILRSETACLAAVAKLI